jgi:hypothetical protein
MTIPAARTAEAKAYRGPRMADKASGTPPHSAHAHWMGTRTRIIAGISRTTKKAFTNHSTSIPGPSDLAGSVNSTGMLEIQVTTAKDKLSSSNCADRAFLNPRR